MSERQISLMINVIKYGYGKRKLLGKFCLIIQKYLQYIQIYSTKINARII
jgi:hypothetical protein